jgi:hypothetical protein
MDPPTFAFCFFHPTICESLRVFLYENFDSSFVHALWLKCSDFEICSWSEKLCVLKIFLLVLFFCSYLFPLFIFLMSFFLL